MSDKRNAGYPDIEKIGEDEYWLHIPIPAHVGSNSRGAAHEGGIVDIHLTGDQVNEWVNKLASSLEEIEGEEES